MFKLSKIEVLMELFTDKHGVLSRIKTLEEILNILDIDQVFVIQYIENEIDSSKLELAVVDKAIEDINDNIEDND